MRHRLLACLCVFVGCVHSVAQAELRVQVSPDVGSGIYELRQTVTWNVSVTDNNHPVNGQIRYAVREGGLLEISSGEAELKDGQAQVKSQRSNPGTLLLELKFKPTPESKEIVVYGGAAIAPEKIAASSPPPEDFDEFWNSKIVELQAVPMNIQIKKVDVADHSIEYFHVTFDNIRGRKIHGQLAKPSGKSNIPALLQVQWAGVYPLDREWILGYARSGWLVLNISAHDLPNDQPEAFYKEQASKELNDYPGMGNEDRETSYFLPMFLSCHRAVEYLTQHSDWNKQTLVVHGGSQGGYQALVTAGLHPAVTALAANVPAGCDHTGKQVGRSPGWPNWAGRAWQGKDEAKMLNASRYFDALNFATRVKCPALIGLGLADTACPAEGVLATCNQLRGPKTVILMPEADHGGDHSAYSAAFGPFLEAQRLESGR